jgi:UDP-glucose 4-epimerase
VIGTGELAARTAGTACDTLAGDARVSPVRTWGPEMHILVTGGAGYIGSITTRLLLDAGHSVTVLDTLEHGSREAVDPRARLLVGSVGERGLLDEVLPGIDAVMHLAALIEVGESEADPGRYFEANVAEPLEMLRAMTRHAVRAFVFSSTAAVYGDPATVPITEDAVTAPINAYGASKLMFEQMLETYARERSLRPYRLRYFNAAGAWPNGDLGESHRPETHLIPRILSAMASGQETLEVFGGDYPTADGTCVRDYVHVLDLARAHQLALERLGEGGPGGVLNLGSGRGYSNLEVVHACAEVTGHEVDIVIGPRRAGDPAVLVASNARARSELGWSPERGDLRVMIEDAWRWQRAHPDGHA